MHPNLSRFTDAAVFSLRTAHRCDTVAEAKNVHVRAIRDILTAGTGAAESVLANKHTLLNTVRAYLSNPLCRTRPLARVEDVRHANIPVTVVDPEVRGLGSANSHRPLGSPSGTVSSSQVQLPHCLLREKGSQCLSCPHCKRTAGVRTKGYGDGHYVRHTGGVVLLVLPRKYEHPACSEGKDLGNGRRKSSAVRGIAEAS